MTSSYQDLQDGPKRRFWSHGRVWFRRSGEWWDRRFGVLQIEWTVPMGHCGWSIRFGGDDDGRALGCSFAIPFLATVYVTLERVFARRLFAYDFDRGSYREIGCYFAEWCFRYRIWVGGMASWSRSLPWCRWWRQGSIDFPDLLLGRTRCTTETTKPPVSLVIPMPEGRYNAIATFERRTWKRPRWFGWSRDSVNVQIPTGIPFAGKGENSWDCDDDGLFGYAVEGDSIERAIAHGVESVLKSRKRYGNPSLDSIKTALAG